MRCRRRCDLGVIGAAEAQSLNPVCIQVRRTAGFPFIGGRVPLGSSWVIWNVCLLGPSQLFRYVSCALFPWAGLEARNCT